MKRALNFIAGCALATFAVITAAAVPGLVQRPGYPIGAIVIAVLWAASAAWGALVLMARSDR